VGRSSTGLAMQVHSEHKIRTRTLTPAQTVDKFTLHISRSSRIPTWRRPQTHATFTRSFQGKKFTICPDYEFGCRGSGLCGDQAGAGCGDCYEAWPKPGRRILPFITAIMARSPTRPGSSRWNCPHQAGSSYGFSKIPSLSSMTCGARSPRRGCPGSTWALVEGVSLWTRIRR
jgi:hypothetical protein